MNDLYIWFHDDITWCGNECSNMACERNIANRLSHKGLFSMAMLRDTELCPIRKTYTWKKVFGRITAGGDPAYVCGKCGKGDHVYGVEHPEKIHHCRDCGAVNLYEDEKQ